MKHQCILAAIFSLLMLSSCERDHQYQYFDYEDLKISNPSGYITVAVRGSWKEISTTPKLTQRGSPYVFILTYCSDRPAGETVILELSRFQVGSTLEVPILQRISQLARNPVDSSNTKSTTSFLIKDLIFPHETINVEGSVTYSGTVTPFTATLVPKYWSEYRNSFWDMLSSV